MFYSVVSPYISQNSSITGFIYSRACEVAKSTGANLALKVLSLSPDDPTTLLRDAVLAGSVTRVKLAFIAGADPNHNMGFGRTPLHHASNMGHSDILALLLNARANPNILDKDFKGPLHMAKTWLEPQLQTATLLLKAGADPNVSGSFQQTPFHEICFQKNYPAIDLYLQYGARFSEDIYHTSVKEGNLKMLKRILKHETDFDLHREFIDRTPHQFEVRATVLHYICDLGHPYSSRHTTPKFVTALLEAGANPDLKDADGNTPFHLACMRQPRDVVECLVDFKAKQSLRRNPVPFLFQRELGQHKSYIDSHNFFHFLNQQNKKGQTPLHLAVKAGNKDVVEYLLENGAAILPDSDGETPLDLAFADPNILDLFKKHTSWANEAAANYAFEKRNFPALLFILQRRPLLSSELRQKILADAQRSGMGSIRQLLERKGF